MAAQQQTLDELKAENAKAEEEASINPQTIEVDPEVKAAEVIPEVVVADSDTQSDAEADTGETGKTEDESWMTSDESTNADEVPNSAWKAAREKYKAKLGKVNEEHDGEVARLRAENDRLKNGAAPTQLNRPKREDFDDKEDPEEAYIDALTDFKYEQNSAKQAARTTEEGANQKQQAYQAEINGNLDQHYERAAKLSEQSGIAAEVYQSSDKTIRAAIDAVRPGAGDIIVDGLIANLGEGSEKVFYSLGVNSAKRDKLTSLLTTDPSGIKAAMYLGTLKAELTTPKRKTTNAPAPAPNLQGDGATKDPHKQFKKDYEKASAAGDSQGAFNARMAAKKAGANLKTW
jgi:hypothetical protein